MLPMLHASDCTCQIWYKKIWEATIHSKGSFCLYVKGDGNAAWLVYGRMPVLAEQGVSYS
jgi:hypothetical protein